MRRASAQAWLASVRSQPPLPLSSVTRGLDRARSAAAILTPGAAGSSIVRSARVLLRTTSTARPSWCHVKPFTPTTASTTLRRLGLAQPLRAGLRSKALPGRRSYSTEAHVSETAKETPASLATLRAEFYKFERKWLNWKIGGVQVPEAVLWLAFFQFLGLPLYSNLLEHNNSVLYVRQYLRWLKGMGLPKSDGDGDGDNPLNVPGFTSELTSWERTAINYGAFFASLSVLAFLWARGRTRNSFNNFVLSRAMGEWAGTYPITKKNVVVMGDTFKILGEDLKLVRKEVSRRAGLKAVQASIGLALASTASSYAFTTWVDAKMQDGVIRFRRSDVLQGETALSLIMLFNFIVSWAVLVYQPYTILPFVVSNILSSRFRFTDITYKTVAQPATPVVTEHKAVEEVDGGKEYITVTEEKSGLGYTRTEKRVFVPDAIAAAADAHANAQSTLDITTKAKYDTDTQRSLATMTKTVDA